MRNLINILIKEPIWKNRSVGIAERKIISDIAVSIDYRDRNGELVFPGQHIMTKEKALTYPTQMVRGVKLRIIPIADFSLPVMDRGIGCDQVIIDEFSPHEKQLDLFKGV